MTRAHDARKARGESGPSEQDRADAAAIIAAQQREPRTIDLTPTPAEHLRIMARMVDGASPTNYVATELRRIATIYAARGVTWERIETMLRDDGEVTP